MSERATDTADREYDLGSAFPVAEAGELQPGTALLVTGPPDVDTGGLALELLGAGHRRGEGAVCVSTDLSGPRLVKRYVESTGEGDDDRLAVVDATGGGTGPDAVESPGDLTGLGAGLSRAIESVSVPRVRLGVVSLTTMLEYLDRASVYKFCHTIASRVDNAGYLAVATLDSTAVNEQTVGMLTEAFDGTIELQEDEKGEVLRVVGLPDVPVTWHAR
jgi:KaiC/GvpD/RAD55 family RecA-like ATPase